MLQKKMNNKMNENRENKAIDMKGEKKKKSQRLFIELAKVLESSMNSQ